MTTVDRPLRELHRVLRDATTNADGVVRDLERSITVATTPDEKRVRELLSGRDFRSEFVREIDAVLEALFILDTDFAVSLSRDLDRLLERFSVFDAGLRSMRGQAALRGLVDELRGMAGVVESELAPLERVEISPGVVPAGSVDVRTPLLVGRRLLEDAVRLLPVTHQARYREEFLAELHVLVGSEASGWAQLRYAVAIAGRVWTLRRALRVMSPVGERVR